MLVLIGWRSRAEIAHASHDARARSPGPRPVAAPVRIGLILAGAVFACWLPYQLSTFDVALYDRMGLRARDDRPHAAHGLRGPDLARSGCVLPRRRLHVGHLTVGIDPDSRFVDPGAGVSPILAVLAAPRGRRGARRADRRSAARLTGTTSRPPRIASHRLLGPLRVGSLHRRPVRHLGHRPLTVIRTRAARPASQPSSGPS